MKTWHWIAVSVVIFVTVWFMSTLIPDKVVAPEPVVVEEVIVEKPVEKPVEKKHYWEFNPLKWEYNPLKWF